MAKVLKKNKYCATLIGANTAQNYRFEPAILQAQKTILCSECITVEAVIEREQRNEKVKDKRQSVQKERIEKDSQDIVATNTGMAAITPVKYKGSNMDGIACSVQKAEHKYAARRYPPFPLPMVDMHTDTAIRDRLVDVWNVTNSIKKKKKDTDCSLKQKFEGIHDDQCSQCENINSTTLISCYFCNTVVCENCNNDNECMSECAIQGNYGREDDDTADNNIIYACKEFLA
jgi:hypothetical protein